MDDGPVLTHDAIEVYAFYIREAENPAEVAAMAEAHQGDREFELALADVAETDPHILIDAGLMDAPEQAANSTNPDVSMDFSTLGPKLG